MAGYWYEEASAPSMPQPEPQPTQEARDAETLERIARRDPEGLRRLLEDYGGRVTWWLRREFRRSLGDPEIDEALYLAAERAWRHIDAYDPARGSLRAWFYGVARHAALHVLRRERRQRHESLAEDPASADELLQPAEMARPGAQDRKFLEDLRACLRGLAPMQRRVLEADLAAGGQADAKLLADELRTTKNSIYVSRSNARRALRDCMTGKGHDFTGQGPATDSAKAPGY